MRLALILGLLNGRAPAQVTYTVTTTDDAFLAAGSPTNPNGADLRAENFGAAGVLAIAPPAATNGEFQTVLKFDLSGASDLFDSNYGTNWAITAITLDFTGNVATNGEQPQNAIFNPVNTGSFIIEWMADDDWVEGTGRPMAPATSGVTYDSLAGLLAEPHEALCTNTYLPPGENVHVLWPLPLAAGLVANVAAGGPVAFRLYAADDQVSYLFNSHNFGNGNQPLIHVTAVPVLRILSFAVTNGLVHLAGMGAANAPYQIQTNGNLAAAQWQTIATVTADASGFFQFVETNQSILPCCFYRFGQPPH